MDQIIVFKLGNEDFGLDINTIGEIQDSKKSTPLLFAEPWHEGFATIYGELYTVINLRIKLNISRQERREQDKFIILHTHKLAFVVDSVEDIASAADSVVHEPPDNPNKQVIECRYESKNRMISVLNVQALIDSTLLKASE
ncbi:MULTISPECIES: chemotaxis protein CheW [Paenibacillus]|uniref:CheW-like domain-containing protein n=1 Tax=Paenibacillus borealis TaxID=160799 RepID=A0ABX3H3A5_PAEBO|nr:chemotaxis protein CheW [Paenibacillus borealis]OMD44507.1 hypothetical protein BSK56_22620 [Paenibacillus borealis]